MLSRKATDRAKITKQLYWVIFEENLKFLPGSSDCGACNFEVLCRCIHSLSKHTLCQHLSLNFFAVLHVLWQKQSYVALVVWAKAGRSHRWIWPLKLNYDIQPSVETKAIKLFIKAEQTLWRSCREAKV